MPTSTYDLLGSAEAAKLLEIGPTNFSHLRKKMETVDDKDFPTPVIRLQCGPIWKRSDMLKFKKKYDSRRRRVHSTNGDSTAVVEETPPAKVKTTAAKAPAKASAAKATAKTRTPRQSGTVATLGNKRTKTIKIKTS